MYKTIKHNLISIKANTDSQNPHSTLKYNEAKQLHIKPSFVTHQACTLQGPSLQELDWSAIQ